MKIDFQGQYEKVSRLIDVSNTPAPSNGEFKELLSSITPNKPQHTKNVRTSEPDPSLTNPDQGTFKAMLRLPDPLQREPFLPSVEVPEGVKETAPSVKTPSVISVKRIHDYGELNYQERIDRVGSIIHDKGKAQGIDPALGMAVVAAESSFNPSAISQDGHHSKGLFQLLDTTGKELHLRSKQDSEYDPFDPHQNVELGLQYLRRLHDTFSEPTTLDKGLQSVPAANSTALEKLAVAAFNAGEGRVASAQAQAKANGLDAAHYDSIAKYLPQSTQEYVGRVMAFKRRFEGGSLG